MRLKRLAAALLVLGLAGAGAGWALSAPVRLDAQTLAQASSGDAARGRRIFFAAGCSSCHAKPGAEGDARLELPGGLELKTAFGTFVAPNISSDPQDGIGAWSAEDFANAVMAGVSPTGEHLYPAFPYTSYARMDPADVGDLYAFMKTLPAVKGRAAGHQLGFPYNVSRGIGLWKRLYLSREPVIDVAGKTEPVQLGRYLAEGPGHCGECHTPRNFAGGIEKSRWLAGAPAAEGTGNVLNITAGQGGIGDWSEAEIAEYFATGFTPDFDTAGGAMADVQRNLAELTPEDRAALAAYLKAIPPHGSGG